MSSRQTINIVRDLGQARCHQITLAKRDTACEEDPITGCWLFTGSRNSSGYGQVFTKKNSNLLQKGRAAQTAFLLHCVAYVGKMGVNIRQGHHASHTCDVPRCFNPDHIVDESPEANNSRKGCPGPIYCRDHDHLIVDLCSHTPKCIRPPRDDLQCCLTREQASQPPAVFTFARGSDGRVYGYSTANPQNRFEYRNVDVAPPFARAQSLPSRALTAWVRTESSQYSGATELEAAINDPYSLENLE